MNAPQGHVAEADSPPAHPAGGAAVDPACPPPETATFAAIATTFSGEVTLWAAGAQRMFGWRPAEAIGRPMSELADWGLSPDQLAEFVFVAAGGAWTRDVQVTDRTGRRRALRMTATLAAGPTGAEEIILTLVPVDRSAQPLTESFRLIAERGSDLVIICDREMAITYAGPSLYEAYGYRSRDVIGTPAWHYVHPDEVPRLRREWELALATPGDHRELELRVRDADSGWRSVQLRLSNLFADLAISAMVLNLRDVTEQRFLADRMTAAERTLAEFLDAAQEGVWVLDPDGRTQQANLRMAEILKVDYTRLCAGSIYEFLDPQAAEFASQRLSHSAAGVRELYEFSFIRVDGQRRWLMVSGVPRYDTSGRFLGSIALCTDITDRKLLERELERRSDPVEAGRIEGRYGEARYGEDPGRPRGPAAEQAPVPGLDRLSRRELEVVRMLLRGDRVPVIARQLFVSQSTVRNHLSSVFRKLRVRSQQELIVLLRERSLPS